MSDKNLSKYKKVKKSVLLKILDKLNKFGKIKPGMRGFNQELLKNNRGDYGFDEIYKYKNIPFLMISFDGARKDIQYYTFDNTEDTLKLMELDILDEKI